MKVLVKIDKKEHVLKYINNCDGIILGLENFSVDFNDTFTLNEIENIIDTYRDKDVFVAINKSIFNNELDDIQEKLQQLSKLDIKGIFFYDLAVLYLKKKLNLTFDLVWNQTHMVSNYNTCNYYYDKGVKYGYLSGEITKEEILEINKKSNMNFLFNVVSHQIMSLSRRSLLTNYYTSINKEYDNKVKEIKIGTHSYLIREENEGTIIKTKTIFNGIEVLPDFLKEGITYSVVDESLMDSDTIVELLNIINNVIIGNDIKENIEKSYKIIGSNTSFLFNKTIFKVKEETRSRGN